MRKLAGVTIGSFALLAIGGAVATSPVDVSAPIEPRADLIIEKTLPDDYEAELPAAWLFRIDSVNCGDAIFPPGGGGSVESLIVQVDAEGGQTDEIGVFQEAFFGGGELCVFRIIELPVDGWEPVSPAGGVAEVTPDVEETLVVTFANRPPPPEATTTTTMPVETTTTEPEATTTTAVAATTTTVAPTTAPPTTAGTVAPELPATGSSNSLAVLLAGLLVVGGVGAIAASRRS